MAASFPRVFSIKLQGYRPFKDMVARFSTLEVIVGANGAGKSSLFEFLKFLRDSVYQEIPAEIVAGSIGQQIFHRPGPDRFWWSLEVDTNRPVTVYYQGELVGPIGQTHITFERVCTSKPLGPQYSKAYVFMDMHGRKGVMRDPESGGLEGVMQDPESGGLKRQELDLKSPNQLALSTATNPAMTVLYELREFIRGWRFYSAFNIDNAKIRKSVPTQQEPSLNEDAGNLSAVLFYLMTEHRDAFEELQTHLRSVIPGFRNLVVKARGGPGEVIAFWQESGVDEELSLADLSDGILRFLCWTVLCVMPNPPSLICIDEPDQGVHPRTLPPLAGLFEKACERTQILLATHASYFLTQFEIDRLAVMKKVDGEALFAKPRDAGALVSSLEEFGTEELEAMHRSDELEALS